MPRGGRIAIKGFGTWGGRGGSSGSGRSKHQSPDEGHTPVVGVRGGGTTRGYYSSGSSSSDSQEPPERLHPCYVDLAGFVDCINSNASDISVCQETFDAFMACKDAHHKAKPIEPTGVWSYILP